MTSKPPQYTRFSSLTPLFSPRSVAILGASTDPTRIGGRPISYMKQRGYAGRIMPVNPNRTEVQGLPAYASLKDLPEVPDVAIVAVAGHAAEAAVAELAAMGTLGAIVFTAGYAEVDPSGHGPETDAQNRMVAVAKAAGMRVLGPNCLGLFNDRIGFYPIFSSSFEGGWPPKKRGGQVGIASQSGAFGTHLFSVMRNRGIATPLCVTTGNEADVTIGDVIGWMAEDPDTDVIAAYAEGIHEGESLMAALQIARNARKPVVMMKVGSSRIGRVAAQSHTASIAGDDAVTSAVLAEFGVIRAHSAEHLIDIAYAATRKIYPVGNTLGVITLSGGAGVLVSDAAEALDFPMPEMPQHAQDALRALVPFSAPRNPVDCTAQVFNDPTLIGKFCESMVRDGGYTSVLAFFTQAGGAATLFPHIKREMEAVAKRYPDRLYCMSVIAAPDMWAAYEDAGFLVFEDMTRAVAAMHAMGRFGESFAAETPSAPPEVSKVALPRSTPNEADAKILLEKAGIAVVPERACATVEEAVAAAEAFGYPVVLKILSPDILHKSEIGGVIVGVANAGAVRQGFAEVMSRAPFGAHIDGVLVAKQARGVECIMGIVRDPVFGPIAMFGLGGVFVEVLKDVVFRRCPFGRAEAEAMIRSIRAAPLLLGARGTQPVDMHALSEMLSRLSVFAHQSGEALMSVDLNPVFATPDGAFAADAVVEIGPSHAH
jgi:acyl-CoA synthetase (NDP forming)